MTTGLCMFSVLLLGQTGDASSQYWYGYGDPWGYGSGYHHASTVEEGLARGLADIIRSAGAANLMHSEAAKNYEDARRKYMDNRVYGTQKYFEMRRINRQARAAERGPRPTQEDLIRYSNARKPKRLSTSQLDPLTGSIAWPTALRQRLYQEERERLEQLYAERANAGYLSIEQILEIGSLTKRMHENLKKNLDKYPTPLYVEAMSFLKSLTYESYLRPS